MGELCGMIVGHKCNNEGIPTEDVKCRLAASFWHKTDHKHCICKRCYEKLSDDPDIQAEYEVLP